MFNFFKKIKTKLQTWKEFGGFRSVFTNFGADMYASSIIRSCIRVLAEYSAKADPASSKDKLTQMLKFNPNPFMTGFAFVYKIRVMLEIQNTAFILIDRDAKGIHKFYPINYNNFETLQDQSGYIYVRFSLLNGKELTAAWEDLIVLRKDYYKSDIAGESNQPILSDLEMINTTDQALSNAVKSTSNLRGIIKYQATGGLSAADLKKKKDDFIESYTSSNDKGGIGALDKSMDFIPVELKPMTATWTQMREYRENIHRFFGVNDDVLQSKMTTDQAQIFYEAKIEPFLVQLSQEMTRKVFNTNEIARGNFIKYQSSAIQWISMSDKLQMKQYIDIGALTRNEWREMMNLAPIPGGDVPIMRLDTKPLNEEDGETKGNEEDKE